MHARASQPFQPAARLLAQSINGKCSVVLQIWLAAFKALERNCARKLECLEGASSSSLDTGGNNDRHRPLACSNWPSLAALVILNVPAVPISCVQLTCEISYNVATPQRWLTYNAELSISASAATVLLNATCTVVARTHKRGA